MSSAQAAAEYLDSYNKARIGEESANAASSYATKKEAQIFSTFEKAKTEMKNYTISVQKKS